MIGIPASGKSTLADSLGCKIVCPDNIRVTLRAHSQKAFQIARRDIVMALRRGEDVVFDATNTIARWREETIESAKPYATKIVCILMDTEFSECLRRHQIRKGRGVRATMTESVIYRMARQLENNPPSYSEGFDEIISSSEFQK